MSETHGIPTAGHHSNYASPLDGQQSSLVQVGGAMGIAGGMLGLVIFLGACFGFEATFMFSPLPLLLGFVGIILSIVGGTRRHPGIEDTGVLAALLTNFVVIVGSLLLLAAWMKWTVLPRTSP